MTTQSILLLVVFLVALLALSYPLGILLARVGDGDPRLRQSRGCPHRGPA